MKIIFRPASAAAAAAKPDAIKLAGTLSGGKGVANRVINGFLLRATGNGKRVIVYAIEPPPMLGAVFPFYYRPVEGWPVIWTSTVPAEQWSPESLEAPVEVPTLSPAKPTNSSRLGPSVSGTVLSVGGAQPAGLASSVFAGSFVRVSSSYSAIAATRCTGGMNAEGVFSGLNTNRPMLPTSFSSPPSPGKLSIVSITWPFMAGSGQSGYASGIEWGGKAGFLVGHALNNATYTDLNHAAAFRYAVTKAEEGDPYSLSVTFTNDWPDTTLQGVVWAKNAGFAVTNLDIEADPAAADAIFIIEKRSNYREVVVSYVKQSTPVEPPENPVGEWGSGEYCSLHSGEGPVNHWIFGNMYTEAVLDGQTNPAFDYETFVVTAHPDGTISEVSLSQRNSDQTDLSRIDDTKYVSVFGVNTLDGEPRLLCTKSVWPLNKTPGTPPEVGPFTPDMYQNICEDNGNPAPDDGTISTITVSSGLVLQQVTVIGAPDNVALETLTVAQQLGITSWVLVGPGGAETVVGMGGSAPMSFIQGISGVTYCAYAPGLFAVAVFDGSQVEGTQRSLSIKVFSAATGGLIASSPVLFTLASDDIVSITCAKAGTLEPDAGEVIKDHATLLLTITPNAYRNSPYTPQTVPLYAVNNLATVTTVATAPAGTPVFTLGHPLLPARAGAVPRVRAEPPAP